MRSAQKNHAGLRPTLPIWMRWCVGGAELLLVLLIAYLATQLVFRISGDEAVQAATRAQTARAVVTDTDFSRLTAFDPFSRLVREDATAVRATAAPESSLKLDVFGLTAKEGGQGSAIVKMQSGDQKRVAVGDEIAPGIRLAGVYVDRLEISRGGTREAVFLRPEAARASAPATTAVQASKPAATGASNPMIASAADLIASLKLEPVRRGGRIVGFQLGDDVPATLASIGLEGGDILMAANGSPLSSFERLEELGEDLQGADHLTLDYERRGERRQLTFGPNGKR